MTSNEKIVKEVRELDFSKIEELDNLIKKYGIDQSSPLYLSFPDSKSSGSVLDAGMLNLKHNQNPITYENGSPIGVVLEIETILEIKKLLNMDITNFNYENGLYNLDGTWTLGGTMANHLGINMHVSHYKEVKGDLGCVVLFKDDYHYSIINGLKNANIENIIYLEKDEVWKINTIPNIMAVIVTLGTSVNTSVELAYEVFEECNDNNIPIHIDGAQGFIDLLKGRIDWKEINTNCTLSLDFHKSLPVNYGSSFLISPTKGFFDISINNSNLDLGQLNNLVGSRSIFSLPTLSYIRQFGEEMSSNSTKKKLWLINLVNKLNKDVDSFGAEVYNTDHLHKLSFTPIFSGAKSNEKAISLARHLVEVHELYVDVLLPDSINDDVLFGISVDDKSATNKNMDDIVNIFKSSLIEFKIIDEYQDHLKRAMSPASWGRINTMVEKRSNNEK